MLYAIIYCSTTVQYNCTLRHSGAVVVQNDRCTGSNGGRTEGGIVRESYAAYQGPMALGGVYMLAN